MSCNLVSKNLTETEILPILCLSLLYEYNPPLRGRISVIDELDLLIWEKSLFSEFQ